MKIAYFDNAATTYPKPECVYTAMDKYYRELGVNIGRGQYSLSSQAYKLSLDTRSLLLNLFHCANKEIVFTHTATEALNLIIRSIVKEGYNVFISPFEHNAVTRTLTYLKSLFDFNIEQLIVNRDTLEYDLESIKVQFENTNPDVLIVSHASNVCGLLAPIKELCSLSKKYGCVNIIDMCQTAGLLDTDLSPNFYDYSIFDGHKTLYGPLGIGGVVSSKFHDINPLIFGGTGIDSANINMPNEIPDKFEAGSHNILAIAGLYSSLKWINTIGIENIYNKEQEHFKILLNLVSKFAHIKTFVSNNINNHIGVLSCIFDGYSSDDIGNVLNKFNIAVRTGLHCAPLAHKFMGTFPAGTIRFSVSYFNTVEDFEFLEKGLKYIKDNI